MTVTLVTFGNKGVRKDFPVASGGMLIGRRTDADLRIPLREVSREHCRLSLNGKKVILKDLDSSNGTFVNEQRVVQATLKPGDRIKIGSVVFTVQIDGQPAKIAPPGPAQMARRAAADAPTEMRPTAPAGRAKAAAPVVDEDEIDLDAMEELDLDDVSDLDLDSLGLDEDVDEAEDVEVLGEDDLEVDEDPQK